ncbi:MULTISPECIES: YpmS family protein [Sutcliffiella]|uniref:DUF2140 domain-containing protein n=1 Tax=Sutcliffiella cohnii TaxID=33932 RepID=A0A223KQH5_9BACI|nr:MULTISPECIES: YpmS family protein [Sutcliffiella]AST91750.1 hypothetical protein BC6307_10900 [Sutcliffiella cohnii]WBL12966.1 YpmS family protein [Sutcliffiella sp. NC1]
MLQKILTWKFGFIALLTLNIIISSIVLLLVFLPKENRFKTNYNDDSRKRVGFTIKSNKDDLNQLISYYLQKETKRPLNYEVVLTNMVELRGEMKVFEREIPLTMTFDPQVQENGDVLLVQDSMSIGRLQVPVSMVLKYVADNYPLPEWVYINPSDSTIYVSLNDLHLTSDTKVKFVDINLEQDNFVFQLFVPVE